MRDYSGVAPSTLPPPEAPNFHPRLRDMITDIDFFLKDLNRGVARIQVGEVPDGSGNPIGTGGTLDYWFKPGIPDTFLAYMSTSSGGGGTISSNPTGSKGKILFGSSAAFDESTVRLGLGTTSPGAIVELHQTGADLYSPISSITTFASNWIASDGTAGTTGSVPLWNYINESTIDDATYITRNPLTGVGSASSIFGGITLAAQAGTANIRMRMRMRWSGSSAGAGGVSGVADLYDGNNTLIKTVVTQIAAPSFSGDTGFVNIDATLSAAEIATIANWTNMRMGLSTSGGGAGYSETLMQFSWLGLTVIGSTAVNLAAWYDTTNTISGIIDGSGRLGVGTGSDALTAMGRFEASSAAVIPLEVMGAASQTGDHFRVLSSAGAVLTNINSSGDIAGGTLVSDSLNLISNTQSTSVARISLTSSQDVVFDVPGGSVNPLTLSMGLVSGTLSGLSLTVDLQDTGGNNSTLTVDNRGGSASPVPFKVYRATIGSTANLTEWRDEVAGGGNAILSRIASDGSFIGPMSPTTATFVDSGFTVTGSSDATKTFKFELDGASTGADIRLLSVATADRDYTLPNATTTLAGLAVAQTFTLAQTIAPTSGTALTLTPPSGTFMALDSTFTDTAFPVTGTGALTTGIWNLAPTISNAALVSGNAAVFALTPTLSNLVDCTVAGLNMQITANHDVTDLLTTVNGLRFVATTATTGSGGTWSALTGASGNATHLSSDVLNTMTGVGVNVSAGVTGTAAGTVGEARGFNVAASSNNAGTTITLFRGLRVANPTGTGVITTAVGLRLENITKGGTNYAIDSAGGQSRHVGNFYIGAATNPTAKVHIAAGTTAASTAPIKLTSGSLMTAAEVGAVEFLTNDLYVTATTGTRRLKIGTDYTGVMLLGSATIDMQTAATTTIYTTPAGVVTRGMFAVVRDPTASLLGGTAYTITGIRAGFSLTGLTTANTGYIVVRSADLVEQIEVAASTAIQLTVTTGSIAAANATIDIFGYVT